MRPRPSFTEGSVLATSGYDWFLGAVTAASAAATATAAGFTAWMASKTRDLADATRQDADASRDAVIETQKDRELAHRPVIIVAGVTEQGSVPKGVGMRNIGNGPALGCLALVRQIGMNDNWHVIQGRVDLTARESSNTTYSLRAANSNMSAFVDDAHNVRGAVFCRDILNRRYRFLFRVTTFGGIETFEVASYRVTDENRPPWVDEVAIWESLP